MLSLHGITYLGELHRLPILSFLITTAQYELVKSITVGDKALIVHTIGPIKIRCHSESIFGGERARIFSGTNESIFGSNGEGIGGQYFINVFPTST